MIQCFQQGAIEEGCVEEEVEGGECRYERLEDHVDLVHYITGMLRPVCVCVFVYACVHVQE